MKSLSRFLSLAFLVLLITGCEDGIVSSETSSNSDRTAFSDLAEAPQGEAVKVESVLNFVAPLSGNQEVPPVATRASGLAKFKLSKDGTEFSYKLNVANIDGVTQAHIHCGAAGVNGPVVAFLFGFNPVGGSVNGTLAEGTITAADVIARPDSPECPGGVADFDELIETMKAGNTYANVHTLANPPGEIRGQINRGNGIAR